MSKAKGFFCRQKKLQANLLRMENIKHKISELETGIRNLAEKKSVSLTAKSLNAATG